MPMTEDFTAFFNTDEHATAATYEGSTVNGVFDREYSAVLGLEANTPTFTCDESDVSDIAHGDTITIDGTDYTVREIQPDGTGVVVLVLEET